MMNRWPRAGGGADPLPDASYKLAPEDFRVTERLGFEPVGEGEHLLLYVEKTNLTSLDAAAKIADRFGIARRDVGLAGMKDKRAVTRQWFSLPYPGSPEPDVVCAGDDYSLRILESRRHTHKIRRGQLAGNHFDLRLCQLTAPVDVPALQRLSVSGMPNYFGPQRFGRDNFSDACRWLAVRRSRRVSAFKKSLYLSVLRSFLFNEVLAARVRAGNWQVLIDGDVEQTGVPTGPLWGRGRSATSGAAALIETAALTEHREILEGLEYAGVKQQRRPLKVTPGELSWQQPAPDTLQLSFDLPAGAYATVLLSELVQLRSPIHGPAQSNLTAGAPL